MVFVFGRDSVVVLVLLFERGSDEVAEEEGISVLLTSGTMSSACFCLCFSFLSLFDAISVSVVLSYVSLSASFLLSPHVVLPQFFPRKEPRP